MGIVGAGLQGRRHLELMLELRPSIEEIRVFDAVPEASRSLLELAGDRSGIATASAEEAVAGVDVVATMVTVPLEPRLSCAETAPDALLLPVDYDDAMAPTAANEAALYVVDDLGQYGSVRAEHFGVFREPDGELAQVVAGELEVPEGGRRMFLNMGIAMDDVALGALCYDRALELGAGTTIAFP